VVGHDALIVLLTPRHSGVGGRTAGHPEVDRPLGIPALRSGRNADPVERRCGGRVVVET
jgi:hypothetical protein